MKVLSSALIAELGLTITRPGYLVQLDYHPVIRLSTIGDVTWNSAVWATSNTKVSGINQTGSGGSVGSLILGNTDFAYSALILAQGAADIVVNIYAMYAGAAALGDVVQVFSGVSDGASINSSAVTLSLVSTGNSTLYSPRRFISKLSGFNYLQPTGTIISIGGENFVLERA